MRNFRKKRGWRNIFQSRPVLAVLVIVILVFSWNVFGLLRKMALTGENKKMVQTRVAELEKQKEELLLKINKLDTPEGKEESIRERFPVAKEGDGVISIVEDKNYQKTEGNPPKGFWSSVGSWFK